MRIRRAIISIGFVWLFIGAGVTTYYTVTGQTSDTIRGVLTMLLGAVTSTVGLLWARRARRDHALEQPSTPGLQASPFRGHENDGAAPEPGLDRSWRTKRWRISRSPDPARVRPWTRQSCDGSCARRRARH